ncbi:ActD protein [Pyxidicoccus fallax]|uniref:ActD protein n=1 Tax=Pyxidicoccus fallax TaxID=394095 RepID=A0A848LJ99_9BACT|nr:ActD protein [Pyxidicoccus fallax]NMO17758.1 ActD protein [Pyxidicoccus fallax]NPC78219.1 ActD protein [Pyxidicoccus fallax]
MALCIPDWLLERVALGELPPDALADARARLEREPDGAARLARLEEDSRRTLERHPPATVAAEVERRRASLARVEAAREAAREGRGDVSLGVPVAASLVLLFLTAGQLLFSPTAMPPSPPAWVDTGAETERIKGTPMLRVYRQGAGQGEPELLADQARARRGDVLQLRYVAGDRPHGVVVSVDGRGAVTLHHPALLTGSTALTHGEPVALAHAYELDDAPAFERFVFVTSMEPLDVGLVLEAARALARQPSEARIRPLPLPATLTQTSFTLEKVP